MVSGMLRQFEGRPCKRALRKDKKAWVSQLVLPAIFIFMALIIAKISEVEQKPPALKMNTNMLIGTHAAGSMVSAMDCHIIPISPESKSATLNRMVMSVLQSSGDVYDDFQPINCKSFTDQGTGLSIKTSTRMLQNQNQTRPDVGMSGRPDVGTSLS